MEFDNNDQQVGGGIIAVAVLHFIGCGLSLLLILLLLIAGDSLKEIIPGVQIVNSLLVISLIVIVALIVSLILLLQKKKAGVIGYFAIETVNVITGLIGGNTTFLSLALSLVLPVIMGILISQKKEIFGF